jgi:hypothetical protein
VCAVSFVFVSISGDSTSSYRVASLAVINLDFGCGFAVVQTGGSFSIDILCVIIGFIVCGNNTSAS